MNPKTNWFASYRNTHLEIVGPILGYFLKMRAEHFCRILASDWNPVDALVDVDDILAICEKAVEPVVLELSVSERSAKQFEKFVHVSVADLNAITVENSNDKLSRSVIMHELRPELHNWAWECLRGGNVCPIIGNMAIETPSNLNVENKHMQPNVLPSPSIASIENFVKRSRSGRVVKKSKKYE